MRKEKRRSGQEIQAKRAAAEQARKAKRRIVGGNKTDGKFQSAERLVLAHRRKENSGKRLGRLQKGRKVPEAQEGDLLLVIRVRSIAGVDAKIRRAAQMIKLPEMNSAIFVRCDKLTKQRLEVLKPYIVYGTPSVKSVRDLVFKRGHARVEKKRVPLSNNDIVEDALGKKGLVCIEDLVHVICDRGGKHFKEVAVHFLWPFKLNDQVHGFKKKILKYDDRGPAGYRPDDIDAILESMM